MSANNLAIAAENEKRLAAERKLVALAFDLAERALRLAGDMDEFEKDLSDRVENGGELLLLSTAHRILGGRGL